MVISIKRLFTVTLFYLSTMILTGYIETAQATKQEMMRKKILQNELEEILEEEAKDSMKYIEVMTSREDQKELVKIRKNLQKFLKFSLKEHKKLFFKLPLEQLNLILPKMKKLKVLNKEGSMATEALKKKIYLEIVEKEIESQSIPGEEFQKEIEAGMQLEWKEVIKAYQAKIEYDKNDSILLANDYERIHQCSFSFLQAIQKILLECSIMKQQSILPSLKGMRRSMEESFESEKDLMVAIPNTLKKQLRQLAKKISQKVHATPFTYNGADKKAHITSCMMLCK